MELEQQRDEQPAQAHWLPRATLALFDARTRPKGRTPCATLDLIGSRQVGGDAFWDATLLRSLRAESPVTPLKATLLSMAAKRGYPLEDRLQMGYHSVSGRMLRLLESMLDEIRKGFFFPDCTRSGRLHGPAKEFLNGWPSEGAAAVSALASDAEEEAGGLKNSVHVTTDSSDSDSSALEVPQVRRLAVSNYRAFAFCSTGKLACSILSRMVMSEFWMWEDGRAHAR